MKNDNIKAINAHQQQIYDRFERETAAELLNGQRDVLNNIIDVGKSLKIIGLRGDSGVFCHVLTQLFSR
jgi:hypothetical protein